MIASGIFFYLNVKVTSPFFSVRFQFGEILFFIADTNNMFHTSQCEKRSVWCCFSLLCEWRKNNMTRKMFETWKRKTMTKSILFQMEKTRKKKKTKRKINLRLRKMKEVLHLLRVKSQFFNYFFNEATSMQPSTDKKIQAGGRTYFLTFFLTSVSVPIEFHVSSEKWAKQFQTWRWRRI